MDWEAWPQLPTDCSSILTSSGGLFPGQPWFSGELWDQSVIGMKDQYVYFFCKINESSVKTAAVTPLNSYKQESISLFQYA